MRIEGSILKDRKTDGLKIITIMTIGLCSFLAPIPYIDFLGFFPFTFYEGQ